MLNKYIAFFIASSLSSIVSAQSLTTTHLYCANSNGTDWNWAQKSNGDYITLIGYWSSLQYGGYWVGYFTINDKQADLLNQCACFTDSCLNYFPHPGNDSNSYWYLIRNEDTGQFSGGYYTKFNYKPF